MTLSRLEARNLHLAVGGVDLLRDVDIALVGGARTALLGPSGSGKTTLLRALAGFQPLVAGEIRLDGRTPAQIGWPHYRHRVMYVPQRPTLFDRSVCDNLARPFDYRTARGAFDRGAAAELLATVGLAADILDRPAPGLSGGEQQRVCLVRALLQSPTTLLLDEPTAALDADAAAAVDQLLADQTRDGELSVLLATHDARGAGGFDQRLDLQSWSASAAVPAVATEETA